LLTVTPAVTGPPNDADGSAPNPTLTCALPLQLIAACGRIDPSGATVTGVGVVPTVIATVLGTVRNPTGRLGRTLNPAVALHAMSNPIVYPALPAAGNGELARMSFVGSCSTGNAPRGINPTSNDANGNTPTAAGESANNAPNVAVSATTNRFADCAAANVNPAGHDDPHDTNIAGCVNDSTVTAPNGVSLKPISASHTPPSSELDRSNPFTSIVAAA